MLLLCLILAGRLFYLQIIDTHHYRVLSEGNRVNMRLVPPMRGEIVDHQGRPLAINIPSYTLILHKHKNHNLDALHYQLTPLLKLAPETSDIWKKEQTKVSHTIPITLKRNLTWEDVTKLSIFILDFPDLEILKTTRRHYPLGETAAHIIGYIGQPSEKDIDHNKALSLPGMNAGKAGIERFYQDKLTGSPGQNFVEVNARGTIMRTLQSNAATSGENLKLTIDAPLQKMTYERLRHFKSAAAVILNVHTGAILAMVSIPSYTPNSFVKGIDHTTWNNLINNKLSPLNNKAIEGLYSPASLFKVPVLMAALESKKVGPHFTSHCQGHLKVGQHKFHCWKRYGHGELNAQGALMGSCDVYFYEVAQRLGYTPMVEMAQKLGLGQPHNIDLYGEKSGLLPTPAYKKKRHNQNWYLGDTILMSIGQGAILSTPLQWAVMIAQIANGGHTLQPHLLSKQTETSAPGKKLDIHPKTIKYIQDTLAMGVNTPQGTGYRNRITEAGYEMAGKTATAQVRRISTKERAQGVRNGESLPWELRDNAIFMGYAPIHAPQFAVALIIEHGGWGGQTAAPVGRDLLLMTQKHFKQRNKNMPPSRATKKGA